MSDSKEVIKVVEKPVKVRKKHYWWRYLIVFLVGTITPAGVIVGASFFVTPTQLMSVVGIKSSDYITDEYNGKSIMTLISSVVKGDITFNNLDDVSEFTPLADKILDMVNSSLESSLGCTIDMTSIKSASWSDIGNAVINAAKSSITLADVLKVTDSSEKVLQYLCFADDGSKYNLDYLMTNMNNLISNITLSNVIDVGTSGILFELRNTKIGEMETKIKTLPLKDILGIDSSSPKALQYLADMTISSDFNAKINNATIDDLVDVGTDTTSPLYNIRNKTLNELKGSMTLGDFLGESVNDNKILLALKDTQVNQLASKINTLTLDQVLDITDDTTDPNYSPILSALKSKGATLTNIGSKINELTLESILGLTSSSPKILWALKDKKLSDLNDETINSITLESVFSDAQISGSKILSALVAKGTTIGTITTMMDDLNISEMIDVPAPGETGYSPILYSLKDTKISNLSTKIAGLTVADVFSSTDISSSSFLSALDPTTPVTDIGTAVEQLPIAKVFKDSVYEADGTTLKSMWKYLLVDPDDSTDTVNSYLMNSTSFDKMNSNFTKNIKKKKLGELSEDGLIDISTATLEKTVLVSGSPKKVKDMTLQEFFDLTSALL